jgi:hypothetical protein
MSASIAFFRLWYRFLKKNYHGLKIPSAANLLPPEHHAPNAIAAKYHVRLQYHPLL